MKSDADVGPYVLRVEDAFKFLDGVTVLVGTVESGSPRALAPCNAELIVDGHSRGEFHLDAERMPGPLSTGRRAVETKADVDAKELRGRECRLIHH